MITSIAHTAVTVKDMDESIRFYTQVLGFKKAFSIPHYVTGEPWIEYLNVCRAFLRRCRRTSLDGCPGRV